MSGPATDRARLPANWHGDRCGHNFTILACPYDGCIARELYEVMCGLFADAESTAKNSFRPSFADTEHGRVKIPWRDGWRNEDPEIFDLCERAKAALGRVRGAK